MKKLLFCLWFGIGGLPMVMAQPVKLQFRLIEKGTAAPIRDAHVFISDSSLGTVSDARGYCELNVSVQETQELIVSHLSYEPVILYPKAYLQMAKGDTLQLQPNGVNFSEIVLSAKRGNQWKKKFKKFKKALLGEGTEAKNCKILNPEVLRFEEENGTLKATAVDLLKIKNDYLGYDIRFRLEELSVEADGSTQYRGNGQFIDLTTADDSRFTKRRDKIYRHSLEHLLQSLLNNPGKEDLKALGYELTFDKYLGGDFRLFHTPKEPGELVKPDPTPGLYRLYFSEFLTVRHKGLGMSSSEEVQVAVSNAEQQRYGSNNTQSLGSNQQDVISRLYKIEPYLLFDQRGNIINKSAVREYGYWARQRLAATLPIDYNTVSEPIMDKSAEKIDTLLVFRNLIGWDQQARTEALTFLQENWSESYIPPLLDILVISQDPWQRRVIKALLKEHVPSINNDYYEGIQWLWEKNPVYGTYYADFKGYLYSAIDPVFKQYFFNRGHQSTIRLDEIVWGGVVQDGIPPLRSPAMLKASQASYLSDNDIVFGLVINGEARAYPKRILAWHEFFTDEIAEQSVAGVYCTLCGTVIIYNTESNGVKHNLGTSGFLYRSNKLMYDKATQSLWSTFMGRPVVGQLVGQDIELATLPVETTTWGEWRGRYPKSQVLSLDTGHERNYDEGEAYKDYYSNDNLMFPVPKQDNRLANKARVFIPRPKGYESDPLAISVKYLMRKRIHQDQIGDQRLLIITEKNGASRAYAIDDQQFQSYKRGKLLDNDGGEWQATEDALTGPEGQHLSRLPAHEAFWFAWINVFPDTRIIY